MPNYRAFVGEGRTALFVDLDEQVTRRRYRENLGGHCSAQLNGLWT